MRSRHFAEAPIWIPQSEELLALDGKSLLLCEQNDHEYQVHLSIRRAPPNGPDSGKVAIRVWQTDRGSVPFEGGGHIPTKRCSGWSAYLDESAVSQITEGAEHCDFTLRLAD